MSLGTAIKPFALASNPLFGVNFLFKFLLAVGILSVLQHRACMVVDYNCADKNQNLKEMSFR